MLQKVIRTGNSLAITIPAKFVKQVGIKAGDRVNSESSPESGVVEYTFLDMRQLPLSQRLLKK